MTNTADRLRERGCDGKVPMSEWAAHRVAEKAHADGDTRLGAYRCVFCHRWHVGHQPDMRTVELLARVIRGLD